MKLLGFSLRCTADGNRLFPSTLDALTPHFYMQHPWSSLPHVLVVLVKTKKQTLVFVKPAMNIIWLVLCKFMLYDK